MNARGKQAQHACCKLCFPKLISFDFFLNKIRASCDQIENIKMFSLISFSFLIFVLCLFPGGHWPLGPVVPLLVVLSEEQAPENALHAPRPGAEGRRRLAPQTLHRRVRQRLTTPHLYRPPKEQQAHCTVLTQSGVSSGPRSILR